MQKKLLTIVAVQVMIMRIIYILKKNENILLTCIKKENVEDRKVVKEKVIVMMTIFHIIRN
jgi:hypothetical protein